MKKLSIGFWSRLLRNIKLLFSLLKDYALGRYRKLPLISLLAIIGTIFYLLSPVDLISDWIPFMGQLDDTALFLACLYFIEKDLLDYQRWKMDHP